MTHPTLRLAALTLAALVISCSDPATAPESSTAPASAPEFAVAADNWLRRAPLPSTERFEPALAVVPNAAGQSILYAIGGTTSTGASLSKVQAYNVATDTWTYKANVPVPLYLTNGAGVIKGKIYLSGGLTSYKAYVPYLWAYDPATNKWTRKHDMPNTTFDGVSGVINNKLYVLTKCDQEDCSAFSARAFYRYDPTTDRWSTLPLPPSTVGGRKAGVIGGKFYVTAGTNVGVYDPATNAWTAKTPTGQPGNSRGVGVAVAGKLYALTLSLPNSDGTVAAARLDVYDPIANAWARRTSMPVGQRGYSATRVFLNGQPRIEVVGGLRANSNFQYIP